MAVDVPAGVEHLVPAVFGIGLREHHQFRIGRVALELVVAVDQVIDFIRCQRQAQTLIGGIQGSDRVTAKHDAL